MTNAATESQASSALRSGLVDLVGGPDLELFLESGETSLSVRQFSVTERMNEPFSVRLVARSPRPDIDLESIVGRGGGFVLHGLVTRVWTGIVRTIELSHAEPSAVGLSTYDLVIVADLWLLSQRSGHRIFQHLSTPEIAEKILDEWRIARELRIDRAAFPKHEYRVQYGESDLAFLGRLLEEAGISYFFEVRQEGGRHKSLLVLADAPEKGEPRAAALRHVDQPNEASQQLFVTRVQLAERVRPGLVSLRDYDQRRPGHALLGRPARPAPGLEAGYEHYHYLPGMALTELASAPDPQPVGDGRSVARHSDEEAGARAGRWLEALRRDARLVHLESNCYELAPGVVFRIDAHPRADLGASERLLCVESGASGEATGAWSLTVTAVFAAERHRPPLTTAKPRVLGPQTAAVVGPSGEEIHVDELGRVRVRMHWDREGAYDDGATCWLRVSQQWAGAGYGATLLPRVGHEVIIDFCDGDPDQPLVVGRLFSGVVRPPFKLPDHKTRSVLKSDSSPHADGAYSEIMFEDRAGGELVNVQAERNLRKLCKRHETERVGRDRTQIVGQKRVAVVGESDSLYVGGRRLVKVVEPTNLKILEQGDPELGPKKTWLELRDEHITLTVGGATVALDGPDITVVADGEILLHADGQLVIKGSSVLFNAVPGKVAIPSADRVVRDRVMRPGGRVLASIRKLFFLPSAAARFGHEQYAVEPAAATAAAGAGDMPPLLTKHAGTPGKYLDGKTFVDGASLQDVVQGSIADCYLAASMAAVAHARPDLVEQAIRDDGNGKYTVVFKRGAKDVPVPVDSEVPWRGSRPMYAHSSEPSEMWPALMEKAYADEFGLGKGYEGIGNGGNSGTAMSNITGGPSRYQPLSPADATDPARRKALLQMLSEADRKPTVAGTPKPPDGQRNVPSGRVCGWHAYTVTGTGKDAAGRDIVKLRNPWGGSSGTEGEFEMPLEHFVEDFGSVNQNTPLQAAP